MKNVPLPSDWSSLRSSAVLMMLATYLTRARVTRAQVDLILWELAKYGPCWHDPDPTAVIDDAVRLMNLQLTDADLADPRELARFHASIVLQRRGRAALDHALSACARVGSLVARDRDDPILRTIQDAWRCARGVVSITDTATVHQLGADELREFKATGVLPAQPERAAMTTALTAAIDVLAIPPGWSAPHAFAFLLHAARFAERDRPAPLSSIAIEILGAIATSVGDHTSPVVLGLQAEALHDRCCGSSFPILRAVEDQLMFFAWGTAEERELIVRVITDLASHDGVTPLGRSIITATTGILATGADALPRPRAGVVHPRYRPGTISAVARA